MTDARYPLTEGPSLDELGDTLGAAMTVLRSNAVAAGLDAPVPTCPGWSVRDLVAHQGMVHRWSAQVVRGGGLDGAERYLEQAATTPDLLGWYDEGATALLQALSDAPADLSVPTFLADSTPPLRFWVRRQCHETTIHAVDAMAARLGRIPAPSETWVDERIALDGIEELLLGFVPRSTQRVHTPEPATWLVVPRAIGHWAWVVRTAPDSPATAMRVEPGMRVSGYQGLLRDDARTIYLALWNRCAPQPDHPLLSWWPGVVRVLW